MSILKKKGALNFLVNFCKSLCVMCFFDIFVLKNKK